MFDVGAGAAETIERPATRAESRSGNFILTCVIRTRMLDGVFGRTA